MRLPAAYCPVLGAPGYAEFRLLPAEDAQAVVLVEVLVVLEVQGGERDAMGEAAGRNHISLTGRGRPRRMAAADSRPQVAATASSPGSTQCGTASW